jgi:hypothetical protein
MSIWTEFENQRNEIYCGGYDEPKEHIEAVIGATYELYDNIQGGVVKTEVCTDANKDEIEKSLNTRYYENDMWWWRQVKEA